MLQSLYTAATGMAAQDSQTSYLATAARAGSIELPRGIRYQARNRIAPHVNTRSMLLPF